MEGKILITILLVASLLVGTFFVSAEITGNNPIKDYISSIRVVDTSDNVPEVSEAEESTQLTSLATITEEQAKKIAIGSVDSTLVGELTDVELENEDGNVVYAIEFTKDGIETDVKIDAGNGKVLKIESDNDESDVKDSSESELKENKEKESDFEQDGIDHQFEGEEEHED